MARVWSLFLLIIGTLYLAFMYESPAFLLLAVMEAVVALLSFGCLLYYRFTIRATLEVPIDISEPGRETLVQLKVENKSRMHVARMEAQIVVKDIVKRKREKYDMRLSDVGKGDMVSPPWMW